jgi:uncharacterized SAM-binding protein YcdF (DUF218 family)
MELDIAAKIVGMLLSPPGLLLVFLVLGFLATLKRLWLGTLVFALGLLVVAGMSLPVMGHRMRAEVESYTQALDLANLPTPMPQAIVVLGGGRNAGAPEFGGDSVNMMTLERLRYAAVLARKTKLPVLASGGAPYAEEAPEASLMAASLAEDFGVVAKWTETKSRTTAENARFSGELLEKEGIKRVFLVTSAFHMRRAVLAFSEQTGLEVVAAPTGFSSRGPDAVSVLDYLPSGKGIYNAWLAMHERLGYLWYRNRLAP